jgi:hypothetical protein
VPTCGSQKCPLYDMNEVKGGDLKEYGKPEVKRVPLSLHEEHGRSLGGKGCHKASRHEHGGDERYLSHLSLLRRHGPQLIAFLARLAGTLTRPVVLEGVSKDAGDRGRVPVEGVSEMERLSTVCLGERSDRLEDDGSDTSISGWSEWGQGGERRE